MFDMCREKTGMAEECRRSDGKRALRACTECGIYWGPVELRCDHVVYTYTSFIAYLNPCRNQARNRSHGKT